MSVYEEILPDDQPDVIANKFLSAQEEVRVHYKPQPYDIGPNTLKITDKKNIFRIVGLDQDGKKIKEKKPDMMPAIRGTSAGLMNPVPGSGQDPKDTGIFYIGPGCSVEMSGLRLIHEIPPYGPDVLAHGSTTIASLTDNTQESALNIANCAIETNATTAISIRSDIAPGAAPPKQPVSHIGVSDCLVKGKTNTGMLGGNYSSINLGFWGKAPLDMRKATFEMNGCTLDWSVFGVIVGKVLADSNSKFLVTGNTIGPTAFGVCCMFRANVPNEAAVFAKGHIDIAGNTIQVEKYLPLPENLGENKMGAAGIIVRVSSVEDGQKTKTTIKDNEIDMTKLPTSTENYKYRQGIVYELVPPVAQPELLKDVTSHIDHNTILEAKVPQEPQVA